MGEPIINEVSIDTLNRHTRTEKNASHNSRNCMVRRPQASVVYSCSHCIFRCQSQPRFTPKMRTRFYSLIKTAKMQIGATTGPTQMPQAKKSLEALGLQELFALDRVRLFKVGIHKCLLLFVVDINLGPVVKLGIIDLIQNHLGHL